MKKIAFCFCAAVIITVIVLVFSSKPEVRIMVDDDGLSVKHHLTDDDYTVVWECDAGTLSPAAESPDYKAPRKSPYYIYAGLNEKVVWSPEDEDGFSYSTATLKIHVFRYSGEQRYHKCDGKVYSDALTVSIKNGKTEQARDRAFGNPVRADSDDDWAQILVLDRQKSYAVFRYRTGKTLNPSEQIGWETNAVSVCDAEFQDAPIFVPRGYNPNQLLFNSETVCYDFSKFNNFYFDGTDAESYPANIRIEAFITDKKGNRSHVENVSALYRYGEEKSYTVLF